MPDSPKYDRPKVLLVDLSDTDVAAVREAGYRVAVGSLGLPWKVPANDGIIRIKSNGTLRHVAEQEVVVLQQRTPAPTDEGLARMEGDLSESAVWARTRSGEIDPRPWLAYATGDHATRILRHGGVFVVFCSARQRSNLVMAYMAGRSPFIERDLEWSVWDFPPLTSAIRGEVLYGEEIEVVTLETLDALRPHLESATFDCTLAPPAYLEDRWVPIARNKYGDTVAGLITPLEEGHGSVFVLPQVADPGACVATLLDDVLPVLHPKLFPESDNTRWLEEEPYELPGVAGLRAEIDAVHAKARKREAELEAAIAELRDEDGWMHTLLTGTGDDLVDAVHSALEELGLKDVRKVDDKEEERRTGRRREDLQVWGESPIVLVEVKGIANLPKEVNSLQVTKYLIPRIREWKREDVRGLSVINQQRGLPALTRDNESTFQDDVLANAEDQGFGLLTTIDIFRLVRGKRAHGWAAADVASLLYENGRIAAVPRHYRLVGVVEKFFEQAGAVGIRVTAGGFSVGDRIAFKLPIDYVEQTVESMRKDEADLATASMGDHVGVATELTKRQARDGVLVYAIAAGSVPAT